MSGQSYRDSVYGRIQEAHDGFLSWVDFSVIGRNPMLPGASSLSDPVLPAQSCQGIAVEKHFEEKVAEKYREHEASGMSSFSFVCLFWHNKDSVALLGFIITVVVCE